MSEPSQVSVVGPDGGEHIGLGPVRMRILEDESTTGHRLGISESVLPPHTPGPPQHRHAEHDEGFYIVSGTAVFTVGETAYPSPRRNPSHGAARRTAQLRQPGRRTRHDDQHLHSRPVRSVLQGHERSLRERRTDYAAGPGRADAAIRHRAGRRIWLSPVAGGQLRPYTTVHARQSTQG
jgi:hypothetical protein